MEKPIRIAHISDLHFSKITLSPSQFFSKRWLGNLNLILFRNKKFSRNLLDPLVEEFKKHQVDYVLISGDVSTTAKDSEFELAAGFVRKLKSHNLKVIVLPGNHDQYTKSAYRKQLFYSYFPASFSTEIEICSKYNLKSDKIAVVNLNPDWWLVLLDTAIPTSLISSCGRFLPLLEERLLNVLSELPKDHNIIIANHYPLFQGDRSRHSLLRAEFLQEIIKRFPNIKLYLHGHSHHYSITDKRKEGFPIILDSGSVSLRKKGSWNLIELQKNECKVKGFISNQDRSWLNLQETQFSWEP
jgi:3',5'-cyclic AMP phosphodiesterase CpdA